jgi:DNA-binding Xre family transcriptional regulator
MRTENFSSFMEHILQKLNPSDLFVGEHRLAVVTRIDNLIGETGLSRQQFGDRVRLELHTVRGWLSGTADLTLDKLTEICQVLHISLGDLVVE